LAQGKRGGGVIAILWERPLRHGVDENMKHRLFVLIPFVLTALAIHGIAKAALPEPGPEYGGLRLRLIVGSNVGTGIDGYDVRLDLLNLTNRPVMLRTDWLSERNTGDFKEYLEAAVSIETYPPIAPWVGQVAIQKRKSPQSEYALKPGQVLTLHWRTAERLLKNKVSDPNAAQNPELATSGLYSVHARVVIPTDVGDVLLRSNEQLVCAGGRHQMPKHTFGTLWVANAETMTARLSLGSLHKIERGDQFQVRSGMMDFWKLTITKVDKMTSEGSLEPMRQIGPNPMNANPRFPERGTSATRIPQK